MHEVDLEVWTQTLAERDRGWLVGPLSEKAVPLHAPISKTVWVAPEEQYKVD